MSFCDLVIFQPRTWQLVIFVGALSLRLQLAMPHQISVPLRGTRQVHSGDRGKQREHWEEVDHQQGQVTDSRHILRDLVVQKVGGGR